MTNELDEGCKDSACKDAWRWHQHIPAHPDLVWVEDTGLEDWEK